MIGDGDVEKILGSGDFDTEVVFTLDPNAPTLLTTRGIFTDATEGVNILTSQVEANMPTIACQSTVIDGVVRQKMACTINGTDYTVERIERIGTGFSLVYLKT